MIPGSRGIFGFLLGGISDKYNIPYIFVEWAALIIIWILYLFFEPSPFSKIDVYLLIFFAAASLVLYTIISLIFFRNLDMVISLFKKPKKRGW